MQCLEGCFLYLISHCSAIHELSTEHVHGWSIKNLVSTSHCTASVEDPDAGLGAVSHSKRAGSYLLPRWARTPTTADWRLQAVHAISVLDIA
eukprot:3932688-Rhodomonas_salina.1